MIGYIDNNLDGMWKPCTEEKFYEIVGSQAVARTIAAVRAGNKNRKRALPAFIFCGEVDEAAYQTYTEKCRQTGEKRKGSRCAQFLRPTGLFMMDFDRTEGEAMELYRKFLSTMREAGISTEGMLMLAHRTPSGHGLRLVLRLREGSTPEADQRWIAELMNEPYDAACKDLSRLSYAVTLDDLFFVDGKSLFSEERRVKREESDTFDNESNKESASSAQSAPKKLEEEDTMQAAHSSALLSEASLLHSCTPENKPSCTPKENPPYKEFPTSYNGIPYEAIVQALAEQLGGVPEHGARNNFIFSMACHLRYVCNDDAEWIARILPTYGEEREKWMNTIRSAVNRPQSRTMPQLVKRALDVAKMSEEGRTKSEESNTPPTLPKRLPPLIELLTRHVPAHARAAVAHAVFPALGAHLGGVKFRYVDNVEHEATFMCVLLAKMSSGKSAVNKPIEYVLADIVERDMLNRQREQEWKNSLNTKGANKEKPKRPDDLCIQVLVSDMTNAAFVQRLADAGEKFLYTQMDEIELLDQLKTSSRGNQVSQLIRLAFDQGLYGQERVGSQSVTARVKVKWNWNASSTIQKGKWYFRNALTDGTLSRLNFCTMEPTKAGEIPVYGTYDGAFADELRPYIDRLNEATGHVGCPEAEELARKLLEENAEHTVLTDDEAYEMLSYRANVIAYLKAMTLYIAHGEWTPEIEEFVRWSEEYDLWCKMHFFGDQLKEEMSRENLIVSRGPKNMLEMLPTRFSREEVMNVRRAQGKSENPTLMLNNWKKRGYIELDETTGEYIKLKRTNLG